MINALLLTPNGSSPRKNLYNASNHLLLVYSPTSQNKNKKTNILCRLIYDNLCEWIQFSDAVNIYMILKCHVGAGELPQALRALSAMDKN